MTSKKLPCPECGQLFGGRQTAQRRLKHHRFAAHGVKTKTKKRKQKEPQIPDGAEIWWPR